MTFFFLLFSSFILFIIYRNVHKDTSSQQTRDKNSFSLLLNIWFPKNSMYRMENQNVPLEKEIKWLWT